MDPRYRQLIYVSTIMLVLIILLLMLSTLVKKVTTHVLYEMTRKLISLVLDALGFHIMMLTIVKGDACLLYIEFQSFSMI